MNVSSKALVFASVLSALWACNDKKGSAPAAGAEAPGEKEEARVEGKTAGQKEAPPVQGGLPELATADEIEVKFYFQPDGTGDKTENKRLELEGDKLDIEEADTKGVTNRVERKATPEEIATIHAFVKKRFPAKEYDEEHPRVELDVEVSKGEQEAESNAEYKPGTVPSEAIEFQKKFFKSKPFQ